MEHIKTKLVQLTFTQDSHMEFKHKLQTLILSGDRIIKEVEGDCNKEILQKLSNNFNDIAVEFNVFLK